MEEAEEFNLEFSDKYIPLFQLLDARDVVKSPEFAEMSDEDQAYWVSLTKVDKVCMSGGRYSGKTYVMSVFKPVAAKDYNHSILSTRYTMSSLDMSTSKALEMRIEQMGMDKYFNFANNTFSVADEKSRGEISITGHKNSSGTQTAKLKSIEDYSMLYTDEGEEMPSFQDWDKVNKSLRRLDVQCISIISFNPPPFDHWLNTEMYEGRGVVLGFNGVVGDTLYIHTTYLDNGEKNIAPNIWADYESKRLDYELWRDHHDPDSLDPKIIKNAKYYFVNCLGNWSNEVGNVIYTNWNVGEFNPHDFPEMFGLDLGSSDPDALLRVAIDKGNRKIWVQEEYYRNDTSADGLKAVLLNRCGNGLIVSDYNEARLVKDLFNAGLNIKKARKTGNASPLRRIKTIQSYELIIEEKSINLQRALRRYAWHDKRSGVIKHEFSHLPNALEYVVIDYIEYVP